MFHHDRYTITLLKKPSIFIFFNMVEILLDYYTKPVLLNFIPILVGFFLIPPHNRKFAFFVDKYLVEQ